MNAIIEKPEEAKHFGNQPTLKTTVFDVDDLFQLGRRSCALESMQADFVIGTTADGTGKYIRLPLSTTYP